MSATATPMRGVHHLVLVTENMKMTIDFYTEVMRMPLVHAMRTPPGGSARAVASGAPPYECIPHYFFDMGNDSLLAFFEMPENKEPVSHRNAIGGMQHVSFVVTRGEDYEALKQRLNDRGIKYSGPKKMVSSPGYSIYFYDPNGVRLEACHDPAGSRTVAGASQTKEELRGELAALTKDTAWIEKVISGAL